MMVELFSGTGTTSDVVKKMRTHLLIWNVELVIWHNIIPWQLLQLTCEFGLFGMAHFMNEQVREENGADHCKSLISSQ